MCLSLTYPGRKCDGWTAAFNRGSLLCLEAIQPKGNPHIPSSFHPSRTTPSPSHSPRHSPGYYPSHSYQQYPLSVEFHITFCIQLKSMIFQQADANFLIRKYLVAHLYLFVNVGQIFEWDKRCTNMNTKVETDSHFWSQ